MEDAGTVELGFEEREKGRVARLTLSNPAKLNALSPGVVAALKARAGEVAADDTVRAVILAGAGERAFAAGADLDTLASLDEDTGRAFIIGLHEAIDAIRWLPVPVVAMLRGPCLGGAMEVAAAADIRVADETLVTGMPEVRVGIPSVIEACLLPRLIGWGKAAELILTGETVTGAEAHRIGFVQRLAAPGELEAETWRVVDSILAAGPGAIRAQKRIMRGWETLPQPEAIALSVDEFAAMFATDEPAAYMRPFLERKKKG